MLQTGKMRLEMKQQEKERYRDVEELRRFLKSLKGKKFRLDCGHKITFCHHLGNNLTVLNGKEPRIICSLCGY
jgi:hypothetical protein